MTPHEKIKDKTTIMEEVLVDIMSEGFKDGKEINTSHVIETTDRIIQKMKEQGCQDELHTEQLESAYQRGFEKCREERESIERDLWGRCEKCKHYDASNIIRFCVGCLNEESRKAFEQGKKDAQEEFEKEKIKQSWEWQEIAAEVRKEAYERERQDAGKCDACDQNRTNFCTDHSIAVNLNPELDKQKKKYEKEIEIHKRVSQGLVEHNFTLEERLQDVLDKRSGCITKTCSRHKQPNFHACEGCFTDERKSTAEKYGKCKECDWADSTFGSLFVLCPKCINEIAIKERKACAREIFEDVEKYSKEEDYHVPELLKFLKAKYLAEKSE